LQAAARLIVTDDVADVTDQDTASCRARAERDCKDLDAAVALRDAIVSASDLDANDAALRGA